MGRIIETIQISKSKLECCLLFQFDELVISHELINLLFDLLSKVIFIHSSDTDGRALVGRFQSTSQNQQDDVEIKIQVLFSYLLLWERNEIFAVKMESQVC